MSIQPVIWVSRTAAHDVENQQESEDHRADSNGDVKWCEITDFWYYGVYGFVRPISCKVSVYFRIRHSQNTGVNLLKKKSQSGTNTMMQCCGRWPRLIQNGYLECRAWWVMLNLIVRKILHLRIKLCQYIKN